MVWGLVIVSGLLWFIYGVLQECLAELRKISSSTSAAQNQLVDSYTSLESIWDRLGDIDRKLSPIEDAASFFHDERVTLKNPNKY